MEAKDLNMEAAYVHTAQPLYPQDGGKSPLCEAITSAWRCEVLRRWYTMEATWAGFSTEEKSRVPTSTTLAGAGAHWDAEARSNIGDEGRNNS